MERVVPEGAIVILPCPVHADPDTLFFEWLRDREPLGAFADERYRIQGNGALKIKSVVPEDTGLYVCRAVNGFGKAHVNVTLIVLSKYLKFAFSFLSFSVHFSLSMSQRCNHVIPRDLWDRVNLSINPR